MPVSTRRRTLMAATEADTSSVSDANEITSALAQVQIQDKWVNARVPRVKFVPK